MRTYHKNVSSKDKEERIQKIKERRKFQINVRYGANKGRKYIHNVLTGEEKIVEESELETFLSSGWELGISEKSSTIRKENAQKRVGTKAS